MWIGVLWAGLRVAMLIAHVRGKFRHGLLEKSLKGTARRGFPRNFDLFSFIFSSFFGNIGTFKAQNRHLRGKTGT